MRPIHWLRSLKSQVPAGRRQSRYPTGRGRLELEALEDRYCPSAGLLDTTFNGTGTAFLPNSVGRNAGAVIYPGGKIVTAGNVTVGRNEQEISVTRLNQNGTLDTTFNGTGSVTIVVGDGAGSGPLAIQPDGKILVGGQGFLKGSGNFEFLVARLNANGTLDKTFGAKGIFVYHPMANEEENVSGLAVLADGSILVGGSGHHEGFVAMKLTASGSLDTTFGSGGVAQSSIVGSGMNSMAVVPGTGQIVMVGSTGGNAAGDGCIAVFTAGGKLDSSFNGTGYMQATTNPINGFVGVALQGNVTQGFKIVVAGGTDIARYYLTGALDTTFGGAGTGYFVAPLLNPSDPQTGSTFGSLTLESDGSIVVGGSQSYLASPNNYQTEMMVAYLSVDGTLDTTFGPNGTGFTYAINEAHGVYSLAIDPTDNRIVGCGGSTVACLTLS